MKKSRTLFALAAALIICALILAMYSLDSEKKGHVGDAYSSKSEALEKGLKSEQDSWVGKDVKSTKDDILAEMDDKGDTYYLVKVHSTKNNVPAIDIYAGCLRKENNKYYFERITPVIPFEAVRSDNTPSLQVQFEYDKIYYAVGIMFDKNYAPYLGDKKLPTDSEGMYGYISADKAPEIDYRESE